MPNTKRAIGRYMRDNSGTRHTHKLIDDGVGGTKIGPMLCNTRIVKIEPESAQHVADLAALVANCNLHGYCIPCAILEEIHETI